MIHTLFHDGQVSMLERRDISKKGWTTSTVPKGGASMRAGRLVKATETALFRRPLAWGYLKAASIISRAAFVQGGPRTIPSLVGRDSFFKDA